MKKATRKEIEQIADNWYRRGQKLGEIYNNPHTEQKRKQKAFILITKMSVRLTNIALMLQPKMPSSFEKSGVVAEINLK